MDRKVDDIIRSRKQFVHSNDELTDSENINAVKIIAEVQQRWARKANTKDNLEMLRDEVLTRLAEINVSAEFDPSPCFYGESPIVEFRGKISGDSIHKYGKDHERHRYEILKAKERGEDYLGEKESIKSRKEK